MSIQTTSPAVAVALAHCQAWSNHDFDTARKALAHDVTVTATTTNPTMPATDLSGIDDYMRGLVAFAEAVEPGSLREIASVGDHHNALVLVTVKARFGPADPTTLPAARLYLIDDNDKINAEHVVFFIPDE